MRILLTGFEPFGPHANNSSARVTEVLANTQVHEYTIATAILPVSDESGSNELFGAIERERPQAVLCLGQAARRAAISIERIAINLKCYETPDNDGRAIVDAPICVGGPAAYFATLPVRSICHAIRNEGIPAELSQDAGTYLCNQVSYALLHRAATDELDIQSGFIHLPLLPEQAAREPQPMPSMDLATMCRAVTIALRTISRNSVQPPA